MITVTLLSPNDAYLTVADTYLVMRLDASPKCLNVKTRIDSSKELTWK